MRAVLYVPDHEVPAYLVMLSRICAPSELALGG